MLPPLYYQSVTAGHESESVIGCSTNSRHWFTTSLLQPLPYLVMPYGPETQFFVGAQTVVSLLQTTETKQDVSFIVANKVYTSTNKATIV